MLTVRNAWLYRIVVVCILLCPITMKAQRIKKICGTYTYYAEGYESQNEAKQKALEGARNRALAKEFGSKISQTTTQEDTSDDGVEHSYFAQLSTIEVEGEWIEDVEEPVYEMAFVNNQMTVKCTVCGKARQKTNKSIEFEATVLRGYPTLQNADVHFRNGENMYLHFQSPANGYVAVYLSDESHNTTSCLLPYGEDTDGQQKVKGGKEYIFFCWDKAEPEVKNIVQQYTLGCADEKEYNKLHVIFSKNPFTKAIDHQVRGEETTLPRQLSYQEFMHWLHRLQAHDPEMGYQRMNIEIRK